MFSVNLNSLNLMQSRLVSCHGECPPHVVGGEADLASLLKRGCGDQVGKAFK